LVPEGEGWELVVRVCAAVGGGGNVDFELNWPVSVQGGGLSKRKREGKKRGGGVVVLFSKETKHGVKQVGWEP